MADNTVLNSGSGGDTVRDLDRAGIKTQIVALDLNPGGSEALMAGVMPVNDNSGSLTVDGTVAASNLPSTVDTNSGNKSASTVRVVLATDQPALTNKLLVTPDSVALPANQSVNVSQINGVTPLMGAGNTGTGSHRVTIATDQAAVATTPAGNVAHDGVDSGNPLKIGFRAIAHGTNPTAVAAADRTDWLANRAGVPFVMAGHPNIVSLEAAYTAAQTDTAIVTVGAGLKIVVTQVQVICDNANTVNVAARVGFGTANTPTTTGVVLTHPGIPAGSGVSRGDGSGILGIGADNEDLRITSGVPTTGSVRVLVSYYTIES